MQKSMPSGDGLAQGRPCTIGREGQIRIDDTSLSREHAEIRFIDGRLRLRDLGSTNGTFLIIDGDLIRIKESYVAPCQEVVLGTKKCTVKALLALTGIHASYSEVFGLVIKPAAPDAAVVEVDTDDLTSRTIPRLFEQPPQVAGDATN